MKDSLVRKVVALGPTDTQSKIRGVFNDAQGKPVNGGEGSFGHAIAGFAKKMNF